MWSKCVLILFFPDIIISLELCSTHLFFIFIKNSSIFFFAIFVEFIRISKHYVFFIFNFFNLWEIFNENCYFKTIFADLKIAFLALETIVALPLEVNTFKINTVIEKIRIDTFPIIFHFFWCLLCDWMLSVWVPR